MKYTPLNKNLYIKNRAKLVKKIMPNSLAVFNSNDIMPTNADGTMSFRQNNDLFYLTGIDQEETILIVFPNAKNEAHQEILFLKETNEHIAIWEGHKYTKEEAKAQSGIKTIYWLSEFEKFLQSLMFECQNVYLNTNEHLRAAIVVETRDARFGKWCKEKYNMHQYLRVAPIMHQLRAIKEPEEIEAMQTACDITDKAFRRVLGFIKPGTMEYEIEAEIQHEFLRNRSKGPAYESIIASGYSACVLHYIENNKECKDGDLILMDFGAEYANYSSDLSRTIPVNGKFSARQKAVYEAVLRVQKEAINMLQIGTNIHQYHKEVGKIMESELIGLKLIDATDIKNQNPNWPAYKKYFMHGTSHYLGLDTHDVGSMFQDMKMEENMVFTCEPGIYIPKENMGIRIEDDLLITKDKAFNLMKNIPKEIEEIEALMNK